MPDTSGWGPQQPHWGPTGWGPPGWGPPPPPPPKPGVIPLAPLDVGDILGGTFATMRRYAKPLFGTAASAYGLLAAVMAGALFLAYAATRDDLRALSAAGADFSWEHGRPLLIAFGAVWLTGLLASLAVNSFIQAACAATLHDAVIGRRPAFGAVWRRAWSRTPAVTAVTVLLALILLLPVVAFALLLVGFFVSVRTNSLAPVLLLLLLFFLVIPLAAWLYVLFAFAPATAVLESAGPLTALRRSARLVRGAWWRTFGLSLLAGGMVMAVSMLFRVPMSFLAPAPPVPDRGGSAAEVFFDVLRSQFTLALVGLVGTLLAQLLATVFLPLVTALLYIDRRIRKEGLAHALAEATARGR
ncbi:hypothetical protein [Streptomyces sp. DSM 118878]